MVVYRKYCFELFLIKMFIGICNSMGILYIFNINVCYFMYLFWCKFFLNGIVIVLVNLLFGSSLIFKFCEFFLSLGRVIFKLKFLFSK